MKCGRPDQTPLTPLAFHAFCSIHKIHAIDGDRRSGKKHQTQQDLPVAEDNGLCEAQVETQGDKRKVSTRRAVGDGIAHAFKRTGCNSLPGNEYSQNRARFRKSDWSWKNFADFCVNACIFSTSLTPHRLCARFSLRKFVYRLGILRNHRLFSHCDECAAWVGCSGEENASIGVAVSVLLGSAQFPR